jgi:hypothetical protein
MLSQCYLKPHPTTKLIFKIKKFRQFIQIKRAVKTIFLKLKTIKLRFVKQTHKVLILKFSKAEIIEFKIYWNQS